MTDVDRERSAVEAATAAKQVIYRHRLPTRIWHWLNAAVILVLLMSGLMIFNAHERLYWGQYGANPDYAWLQDRALRRAGFSTRGRRHVPHDRVFGRLERTRRQYDVHRFPRLAHHTVYL